MRTILVVLLCVSVKCNEESWFPFDVFMSDMTRKTQEVQKFVADQENKFIEDVSAKTKEVQDFMFKQEKNAQRNLNAFDEGNKQTNDKVVTYLKDKNENFYEDFKHYFDLRIQPKDLLTAIPKLTGEIELMPLPEAELSTPGMVAAHGYHCESHTVLTNDGYILTLHRIPRGLEALPGTVPSKTVLLHHGLFASSADWVFAGPKRSLGYILADDGYDVWMANVRGNRYSREHATLKTNSIRYWNFSWHEVALYDLPAVIDYIDRIKGTDTKINYIGHSMGTTILFALLTTKPEYNERLNAGFALAPVVYMSGIRGPIRSFASSTSDLGYAAILAGAKEFMPREPGRGFLGSDACNTNKLDISACEKLIFMLCGFDEEQLERSMLLVFLAHIGSGTSMKTVVHFAQEISAGGRFQQFHYGFMDNINLYGTATPPEYSFENVTLPVALFSSKNDWLSSEVDVMKLYNNLKHKKEHYTVPHEKFNHMDYLWAKDVSDLLHGKLIEVLNNWNP